MPRGDRSNRLTTVEALFCALAILGSAFLIYAVGVSNGVSSGRNEVSAREHYDREKKSALESCRERQGQAFIQCVTEAIETAQEQSDSRQDLYSQRDMANSAFLTMILAAIGVMLSGGAFWALLRTIQQGQASLSSAQEANEISRRALYAQEPLLHVEMTTMDSTGLAKGMLIKNLGQTPAIVTAVCRKWDFGPIAPSRIITGPEDKHSDEKPVTRDAIKADGGVSGVSYASMLGDYPTSIGVDPCGFFYGYIRYITTYGFERTHEFCLYGDIRHPSGFDKRHQE